MKKLYGYSLIFALCLLAGGALARVCFVPSSDCDGGDLDINISGEDADSLHQKCADAGFTYTLDTSDWDALTSTSCGGAHVAEYCPYDRNYVKCCPAEYAYLHCEYPLVEAGQCGMLRACVCPEEYSLTAEYCRVNNNNATPDSPCVHHYELKSGKVVVGDGLTYYKNCRCSEGNYKYCGVGATPENSGCQTCSGVGLIATNCCRSAGENENNVEHCAACTCSSEFKSNCDYGGVDEANGVCTELDGTKKFKNCCSCDSTEYPYATEQAAYNDGATATVSCAAACINAEKHRYKATACDTGYILENGKCIYNDSDCLGAVLKMFANAENLQTKHNTTDQNSWNLQDFAIMKRTVSGDGGSSDEATVYKIHTGNNGKTYSADEPVAEKSEGDLDRNADTRPLIVLVVTEQDNPDLDMSTEGQDKRNQGTPTCGAIACTTINPPNSIPILHGNIPGNVAVDAPCMSCCYPDYEHPNYGGSIYTPSTKYDLICPNGTSYWRNRDDWHCKDGDTMYCMNVSYPDAEYVRRGIGSVNAVRYVSARHFAAMLKGKQTALADIDGVKRITVDDDKAGVLDDVVKNCPIRPTIRYTAANFPSATVLLSDDNTQQFHGLSFQFPNTTKINRNVKLVDGKLMIGNSNKAKAMLKVINGKTLDLTISESSVSNNVRNYNVGVTEQEFLGKVYISEGGILWNNGTFNSYGYSFNNDLYAGKGLFVDTNEADPETRKENNKIILLSGQNFKVGHLHIGGQAANNVNYGRNPSTIVDQLYDNFHIEYQGQREISSCNGIFPRGDPNSISPLPEYINVADSNTADKDYYAIMEKVISKQDKLSESILDSSSTDQGTYIKSTKYRGLLALVTGWNEDEGIYDFAEPVTDYEYSPSNPKNDELNYAFAYAYLVPDRNGGTYGTKGKQYLGKRFTMVGMKNVGPSAPDIPQVYTKLQLGWVNEDIEIGGNHYPDGIGSYAFKGVLLLLKGDLQWNVNETYTASMATGSQLRALSDPNTTDHATISLPSGGTKHLIWMKDHMIYQSYTSLDLDFPRQEYRGCKCTDNPSAWIGDPKAIVACTTDGSSYKTVETPNVTPSTKTVRKYRYSNTDYTDETGLQILCASAHENNGTTYNKKDCPRINHSEELYRYRKTMLNTSCQLVYERCAYEEDNDDQNNPLILNKSIMDMSDDSWGLPPSGVGTSVGTPVSE